MSIPLVVALVLAFSSGYGLGQSGLAPSLATTEALTMLGASVSLLIWENIWG